MMVIVVIEVVKVVVVVVVAAAAGVVEVAGGRWQVADGKVARWWRDRACKQELLLHLPCPRYAMISRVACTKVMVLHLLQEGYGTPPPARR